MFSALLSAERVVEGFCFGTRRELEGVLEGAGVFLVLLMQFVPLFLLGVEAHQLLVGGFVPGLELELALGVVVELGVIVAEAGLLSKGFEEGEGLMMVLLLFLGAPYIKGGAVRQGEVGEEIALVEGDGLLHPVGEDVAAALVLMLVLLALVVEFVEVPEVYVAGGAIGVGL